MARTAPEDIFIINNVYKDWQYEVVEWLNSWVTGDGWEKKKHQLYLHDASNTGKSTFIEYLLSKIF